jgi:ABC-type arginine transport system permease subunit
MYTGLLHTHSMLRWLMLSVLVLALVLAFIGWISNKKWTRLDSISGLLSTIIADLQLLVGLILYFFVSPITKTALSDFGMAMKNADLRFYAVEHFLLMVIAIVLIHVGRSKAKKATIELKKHRISAIYYGISLLLILAGIPWERL